MISVCLDNQLPAYILPTYAYIILYLGSFN